MNDLQNKKQALQTYLKQLGTVVVAFSGGVDSAFLMKMAKETLGEKAIAVTANLRSFPDRELAEATEFCKREQIRQIVVNFDELQVEGFQENPKNRCYLCKRALLGEIRKAASREGIVHILEGSNLDDCGDYRPGMQAVKELGILSPLKETGFTKAEIRKASRELGLEEWDKPSFACLSSRFPYGEQITAEKLAKVEQAEQRLRDLGFAQFRVRMHGDLARIEVLPQEFSRMMGEEIRLEVEQYLRSLGFTYVALDLGGYRTGSMNESLQTEKEL